MSAKTPYIGSKISLISKAEIRYEGVLYAVDTKEATVTLAKVRSFGTEDRQVPKPIPPRTETYEFIIFRGSDIKDLHVSEMAKMEDVPQDPAIVSATSQLPPIPPPSSSSNDDTQLPPSSSHPLLPPSQPPTYSPFPPAPGGFSPFAMPYFKPQVMMGGGVGGGPGQRQPPHLPTVSHSMHPLPPSHQFPPPFIPGQVPISLPQKSPYSGPDPPTSFAPVISTLMRPSLGTVAEDKSQSPVASSTPQTASGGAAQTQNTQGNVTPAQTTPQAASESESPLARMNLIPPPSQATQAPPPSSSHISHVTPLLDPPPPQTVALASVLHPTSGAGDSVPPSITSQEEKKSGSGVGRTPLISEPPSSAYHAHAHMDRKGSAGSNGPRTERGRGRGGRKSSRAGSRGNGSRGGGASNQQEPTYRYENDFDFESANAQFNKQVLEEEFRRLHVGKEKTASTSGEGGETEDAAVVVVGEEEGGGGENEELEEGEVLEEEVQPGEYYDKTKSFFDSISCETPGGGGRGRRTNWNEERELNTETFGVSSVNRFRRGRGRGRWRGRGRGRGGGYRGYGRGGSRGGRGGGGWWGQRYESRDGEDRQTRGGRGGYGGGYGGGGYYQRSSSEGGGGGYRGLGKRGRGSDRVQEASLEHPQRPTATAGGD